MGKPFKLRDGGGNLRDHVGKFAQSGARQPVPAAPEYFAGAGEAMTPDASNGQAESGRLPDRGPAEKKRSFKLGG